MGKTATLPLYEGEEPAIEQDVKKKKKNVSKKYPVLLVASDYIVVSDDGNGARVDGHFNVKAGDTIELPDL